MITEAQLQEWERWVAYRAIPPSRGAVAKGIRLMTAEIRRLQRIENAALELVKATDDERVLALAEALKIPE